MGQLDFMVVKLEEDEREVDAKANGEYEVRRVIKLQPVAARSLVERVRCGFDPRFIGYYGHAASAADRAFVQAELPKYDLVWLHNIRTPNTLGQWAWPRSVMDVDDIPSTFFRTVKERATSAGERWRANFRLMVAKRREKFLSARFKVVSVCSEADRAYLGLPQKVHVIPNGFARPAGEPLRQPANPPRIGFIGTFDYPPNVESVRWFVRECWPLVKRQIPDARLRLIGKGSEAVAAGVAGVDALGWVADPAAEIATWSVMSVPVRTGAGTRVKIAEGYSRKCPIVSTSLGAFGYDAADGREMFLADTGADFATACVRVIREPEAAAAMAERGWQEFLNKWTWDSIRPRVVAAAEDCLRA
jgi:glycosyltransferase involved in cell wall biosynthesis